MVVQRHTQRRARSCDFFGHGDVGLRRRRIPRRVIMHEDQRRGVDLERALDDLARVDRHVIDRAPRLCLVGNENVLAIKEQHAEFLDILVGQCGVAILQKRVPA